VNRLNLAAGFEVATTTSGSQQESNETGTEREEKAPDGIGLGWGAAGGRPVQCAVCSVQ